MARFRASIVVRGWDECWGFEGSTCKGYGRITVDGRRMAAHRASYMLFYGTIPDGVEIDHICRNKICCNPTHLRAVPHAVNMQNHGDVAFSSSRTGVRGVHWHSASGLWVAEIRGNRRRVTRYFHTREEAEEAIRGLR